MGLVLNVAAAPLAQELRAWPFCVLEVARHELAASSLVPASAARAPRAACASDAEKDLHPQHVRVHTGLQPVLSPPGSALTSRHVTWPSGPRPACTVGSMDAGGACMQMKCTTSALDRHARPIGCAGTAVCGRTATSSAPGPAPPAARTRCAHEPQTAPAPAPARGSKSRCGSHLHATQRAPCKRASAQRLSHTGQLMRGRRPQRKHS